MIKGKIKQTTLLMLAVSAWLLMVATGCSKSDGVGEVEATLKLTKTHVTATEISQFLSIESNASWELSLIYKGEQRDWCRIDASAMSGKGDKRVVLSYIPNLEWDARVVYIAISVGGEERHRVLLTQAGSESAIAKLILTNPNVTGTNTSQFLDIVCDKYWQLSFNYLGSQSGWCSMAEGDKSGTGDKKVMLNYAQNDNPQERKVEIILTVEGKEIRATLTQLGTETTAKLTLTNPIVEYNNTSQLLHVISNGTWVLSFIYEGSESGWCSIAGDQMSGTGEKSLTLNYTQNNTINDRVVRIKIVAGTLENEVSLTQKKKQDTPPPVTGWLELPASKNMANCRFASHNIAMSNKTVRNYSLFYDMKEKLAYWVAYPQHASYLVKNTERTNVWEYDPKFTQAEQVNLSSAINGYDRGHQIASADRYVTYEANAQTFYYTNMTPQIGGFNGAIWASLEGKVRDWSTTGNLDTLYVVTGAILKTVGGSEAVNYATPKKGGKMAIPNYYYKVLLHRTGGGTCRAIGFWFPHKTIGTSEGYRKYAKTVREIEELTGFNFFANLPQEIQDKVENELIFSPWSGL